jgi:hypothetical protein
METKRVSKKSTKKFEQRERRTFDLSNRIGVGTFDAWINKEAKSGRLHARVRQNPEGAMPKNWMDEWLGRQPVVEKEEKKEVVVPIGTTEEWLMKQVSNKLLSEQTEQETQVLGTK